jgi:hypothetical protein
MPAGDKGEAVLTQERDNFKKLLEAMHGAGQLSTLDRAKHLADFDAARATSKMPLYALISIAIAAISAIASAAAAYFAYASLHTPH